MAQELQFADWARGIQGQGLGRQYAEEDAPSFWDKALGVVGGIAGNALGGLATGGVNKLLGGGATSQNQLQGPGFGYGSGQDYAPVDWNAPYSPYYGG